jgi:hypothetical protein
MSFDLVTAIYHSPVALPQDDGDYRKILHDIKREGIESQVYSLLKQQGMLEYTPPFFQVYLKENYEKGVFQNLFIKNQTDLVLRRFEELGMDVIPLKGVYFAEKYFGHVGARATSDIDLLIRVQDLENAIEIVNALGFSSEEELIPGHFHCSFSKGLPYSSVPLVVELHWGIVKERTSRFQINDIWSQSKPIGEYSHIRELSHLHSFYIICLHGWRHNLDSLRYFIDIIQMIHHLQNELSYDDLFQLAETHQTRKRLTRTLSIVYEQFPHLHDVVKLLDNRKSRFWRQRKLKGFKQYMDFIDYQFLSYDTFKHSINEIFHWLFPSRYDLLCELSESSKVNSQYKLFLLLYKKRILGIIKGLRLGRATK